GFLLALGPVVVVIQQAQHVLDLLLNLQVVLDDQRLDLRVHIAPSTMQGCVRGSVIVAVVPTSSALSKTSVPPWASMYRRAMGTPKPVLLRLALFRRRGMPDERSSRSSDAMPMPSSRTAICTSSSPLRAVTMI